MQTLKDANLSNIIRQNYEVTYLLKLLFKFQFSIKLADYTCELINIVL